MSKNISMFSVIFLAALMALVNACGDDEKPEKNECTTASECGDDHICTDGSCVPDPGTSTTECTKASDCGSDEICTDGSCKPDSGTTPITCSKDEECPNDLVCYFGDCIPDPFDPVSCEDCDVFEEDDALDDELFEAELGCIAELPGGEAYNACYDDCDEMDPTFGDDWEECTDVCEEDFDRALSDAGLSDDEVDELFFACLQEWVDEQNLVCDVSICWY